MNKPMIVITVVVATLLAATVGWAQVLGLGAATEFTQLANNFELITTVAQLAEEYDQLVQTYKRVTQQYDQMLQNAKFATPKVQMESAHQPVVPP